MSRRKAHLAQCSICQARLLQYVLDFVPMDEAVVICAPQSNCEVTLTVQIQVDLFRGLPRDPSEVLE